MYLMHKKVRIPCSFKKSVQLLLPWIRSDHIFCFFFSGFVITGLSISGQIIWYRVRARDSCRSGQESLCVERSWYVWAEKFWVETLLNLFNDFVLNKKKTNIKKITVECMNAEIRTLKLFELVRMSEIRTRSVKTQKHLDFGVVRLWDIRFSAVHCTFLLGVKDKVCTVDVWNPDYIKRPKTERRNTEKCQNLNWCVFGFRTIFCAIKPNAIDRVFGKSIGFSTAFKHGKSRASGFQNYPDLDVQISDIYCNYSTKFYHLQLRVSQKLAKLSKFKMCQSCKIFKVVAAAPN